MSQATAVPIGQAYFQHFQHQLRGKRPEGPPRPGHDFLHRYVQGGALAGEPWDPGVHRVTLASHSSVAHTPQCALTEPAVFFFLFSVEFVVFSFDFEGYPIFTATYPIFWFFHQ